MIRRATRGTSLLEVMIAGLVLAIGLAGIVNMLLAAGVSERRGERTISAALLAQRAADSFAERGFANLTAGVFDGGVVLDSSGREYRQVVRVSDMSADSGYPSYFVAAEVSMTERGVTRNFMTVVTTIVSLIPDGGP